MGFTGRGTMMNRNRLDKKKVEQMTSAKYLEETYTVSAKLEKKAISAPCSML